MLTTKSWNASIASAYQAPVVVPSGYNLVGFLQPAVFKVVKKNHLKEMATFVKKTQDRIGTTAFWSVWDGTKLDEVSKAMVEQAVVAARQLATPA